MARKTPNKHVRVDTDLGLWLGTEAGLDTYQSAVAAAIEAKDKMQAGSLNDMLPPLLEAQDGVGVIDISGPLVSGSAGFLRLFGVTGYGDITDALIQAVQNPKIQSIVLSIDSPGGHVAGVQELSALISNIDKLKPVVSHTAGSMMSAAYWLGVSGRRVSATQTAELGSIGTLMVHMEKTKQMNDMGIKATVIRSGKFKALMNPYEALSETAREQAQQKADTLSGIFLSHVADRRKMTATVADKTIGQGRTYFGDEAVSLGAADAVGSLAESISYAKSKGAKPANVRSSLSAAVDTPVITSHNPANRGSTKMNLTEAQAAALASGVPLEDVLKMEPATEAANLAAQAAEPTEAEVAAAAEAAAQAKATADAAAAQAAAEAEAAKNKPKESPEIVAYLQGELAKTQASLVEALASKTILEAKTAETKATQDGLLEIARTSLGRMSVALGGAATAGATLTATELLAEHARVADVFKTKYPVGGVAAVTPNKTVKPASTISPLFLAAAKNAPAH